MERRFRGHLSDQIAPYFVRCGRLLSCCFTFIRPLLPQFYSSGAGASPAPISLSASIDRKCAARSSGMDDRFCFALQAAGALLYEYDLTNDRARYWGDAQQLFGCEVSDIPADRNWWAGQVHPADFSRLQSRLKAGTEAGELLSMEYRVRHRDGRWIWVWDQARVELDESGHSVRLLGCAINIDERRRSEEVLKQQQHLLHAIIDNAEAAIYAKDLDSRFILSNRHHAALLGCTPEEVIGKTDYDLERTAEGARMSQSHDKLVIQAGQTVEFEEVVNAPEGPRCYLSIKFPLLREDGITCGICGISTNISDRKRIEEDLREADRRKDEFLAMLGHELRNPLAAINTGLRLLRGQSEREWVRESVERQTKQLCRLVDDLLDISRIRRGKIELKPEPVNLCTIVARAAESASHLMLEKQHTFTVRQPEGRISLFGDPTRLEQIVVNLLTNAARYTCTGGKIELAVEQDDGNAVLRVRDNGLGIPDEMQEKIFDLFGQVESSLHRPQQGLGIGLSLVRMLVELHHGTVSVQSAGLGQGAEFIVRLPLPASQLRVMERQRNSEGARELDRPGLDILLVEDNRDAGRLLGAALEEKGHRVRIAEDGFSAVSYAAQLKPDMVILDVGLPGISGYDVARKMRQELNFHDVLIIATTGYGQQKDRRRSMEAGIDYHLVKPVDLETLAAVLHSWRTKSTRRPAGNL